MKKRGKALKAATYALLYGASVETAEKTSNLGLRRTKVLKKSLK